MNRYWWQITEEEAARLNPPLEILRFCDDGNLYTLYAYEDGWLSVGKIPTPRTRLGWFVYHLIHGLAMRYPWHKVLGFAFANTRPGVMDLSSEAAQYEEYLSWSTVEGHEYEPMSFDEFVKWGQESKAAS